MSDDPTEVYAWGANQHGQLGLPGKRFALPTQCRVTLRIREISCGEEHLGIVTKDGEVFVMGSNAEGRLGIGERGGRLCEKPVRVDTLKGHEAVSISCGWSHTFVLTSTHSLFSWGSGTHGALGLGSSATHWLPSPVCLPFLTPLKVSCGARHTVLIGHTESGGKELWSCGRGEEGQLGSGKRDLESEFVRVSFPEPVSDVSCGVAHTGFVTEAGRVYTMGDNTFGQLGIGSKKSACLPQRLVSLDSAKISKIACGYHSAVVSDKGEIFIWGTGPFGEYLFPQKVMEIASKVRDVAVGGTFTAVIDVRNRLWTWGSNTYGELGIGSYEQSLTPAVVRLPADKDVRMVACGSSFCVALCGGGLSSVKTDPRMKLELPIRTGSDRLTSRNLSLERGKKWGRESDGAQTQALPTTRGGNSAREAGEEMGKELMQVLIQLEDSENRAERLQSCVKEGKNIREEMREIGKKKEEEIKSLTTVIGALNQQLSSLKRENELISKELSGKTSQITDLQASLSTRDKDLSLLKSSYHIATIERDKIKEMVEESEILMRQMTTKIDEMKEEKQMTDAKLRKSDTEIDTLRCNLTKAKENIDSLHSDKTSLQSRFSALEQEKRRCDTALSAARTIIGSLSANLESAEAEIHSLSLSHEELLSAITTLQDSLRVKESDFQRLDMDYELTLREKKETAKQTNDLQVIIATREGELESVKAKLELTISEKSTLTLEVTKLSSELTTLKSEYQTIAADKLSLKESFEQLKTALEATSARFDAELKDRDEHQYKYIAQLRNGYEEKICILEEEIETLKSAFAEKTNEAKEGNTKNKQLETALELLKKRSDRDLAEKENHANRIIATYEQQLSDLQTEITQLKEERKQDANEINRTYKELKRVHDEAEMEQMNTVEMYENKLLDASKDMLDEQNARMKAEDDLSNALKSIQMLEENYKSQLKKWQIGTKAVETDHESSIKLLQSQLNQALDEERHKNVEMSRNLKQETDRNHRLESTIQSLHEKVDRINEENDRLLVDIRAKEAIIASLKYREKQQISECHIQADSLPNSKATLVTQQLDLPSPLSTGRLTNSKPIEDSARSDFTLKMTPINSKFRPESFRNRPTATAEHKLERKAISSLGFSRDNSPLTLKESADTTLNESRNWGSYGELKAGFQSHLRDIQRKIDECSKIA